MTAQRILVMGMPGSGKTFLAEVPVIEAFANVIGVEPLHHGIAAIQGFGLGVEENRVGLDILLQGLGQEGLA